MKIFYLILILLFSYSVDYSNQQSNINSFNENEYAFIDKDSPVFFDLEQLNIPFSLFQQEINTDEHEPVAVFFYENYLFVYLWTSQFTVPRITQFDQVLVNARCQNDSSLTIFEFGNFQNGRLSVVKYCDILNISVIALDITNDLLDYSNNWLFEVDFVRFNNNIFISSACAPFTATFEWHTDHIEFEINNINVLISNYSVTRLNVSRTHGAFQDWWNSIINWGDASLDLFFFNFDFPLPVDNIHSATFQFTRNTYQRQRIAPFPWSSWSRNASQRITNVEIVPGTFVNPLIPNSEYNFFDTGSRRASQMEHDIFVNYDWSILIDAAGFVTNSKLINQFQTRRNLTDIYFIEMLFETNGTMYRADIEMENGPVRDTDDVYREVDLRYIQPIPLFFVILLWLPLSLVVVFATKKLEPGAALFIFALLSHFINIYLL